MWFIQSRLGIFQEYFSNFNSKDGPGWLFKKCPWLFEFALIIFTRRYWIRRLECLSKTVYSESVKVSTRFLRRAKWLDFFLETGTLARGSIHELLATVGIELGRAQISVEIFQLVLNRDATPGDLILEPPRSMDPMNESDSWRFWLKDQKKLSCSGSLSWNNAPAVWRTITMVTLVHSSNRNWPKQIWHKRNKKYC